jgi:hypothetical protein
MGLAARQAGVGGAVRPRAARCCHRARASQGRALRVALRAILALPLRAMAALMCGRDGSKPPAGSNQSKDCRLWGRAALAARVIIASRCAWLRSTGCFSRTGSGPRNAVFPISICSEHSASNITPDEPRVSSLIVLSNETARRTPHCALAGSVIFEHSRVHLDERRGRRRLLHQSRTFEASPL